jgi:hypothetical protein
MEGGWRLCQFGSTMEAGQAVPHRHKLGRHVDRTCGSARSPLGRGRERNRESGGRLGRGLLMGVWQIVIEMDGMARCVKGQVKEENESQPGGGH